MISFDTMVRWSWSDSHNGEGWQGVTRGAVNYEQLMFLSVGRKTGAVGNGDPNRGFHLGTGEEGAMPTRVMLGALKEGYRLYSGQPTHS
jgi:hypothetical protein